MDTFGFLLLTVEVSVGLWVCFLVWYTVRRRVTTLANAPCSTCGHAYGIETARRARQDYRDRAAAAQSGGTDQPGVLRYWTVACPVCQATTRYYYESERFDTRRPQGSRTIPWRGALN